MKVFPNWRSRSGSFRATDFGQYAQKYFWGPFLLYMRSSLLIHTQNKNGARFCIWYTGMNRKVSSFSLLYSSAYFYADLDMPISFALLRDPGICMMCLNSVWVIFSLYTGVSAYYQICLPFYISNLTVYLCITLGMIPREIFWTVFYLCG